ncbi:MAG: Uma2 family endonuclease [Pyrinomonadaceae bacterium]|nr:Uma2 family endonuclease [Pyrinomonadaceae bacterium]
MELAIKRFQFTVDDFNAMTEQGMFRPTDRLELIEGEIIEISPIGRLHARCVDLLNHFLNKYTAENVIIRAQSPIILDDLSEPQPDISILRFQADFYKQSHPKAADILLIIEVSDSTVEYDRTLKFPKYASAKIPEAWLINLEAERIEVHSNPKENIYGMVKIYQRGEEVLSETMPELKLKADDILG